MQIPSTATVVDKLQLAALDHGRFRSSGVLAFRPQEAKPFEVWDDAFLDIIGDSPTVECLVEVPDYAFAWEAPIWIEETDDVFFVSMAGTPSRAGSDVNNNNKIFRIVLNDTPPGSRFEDKVFPVLVDSEHVQMTNGGTNYRDKLLFANEGRGALPGSIVLIDRTPPYATTCVSNNYHGRRFNSPNDLVVHPRSGAVFFTDPVYGYFQDFCPAPQLPCSVYRFDPSTGHIRVVVEDIAQPNGIVFSPDGSVCYVTDTSAIDVKHPFNGQRGAAIYAFDVVGEGAGQQLVNKRLFAWVDTGVPDGIKSDENGNLYSGCGDGVHVWNPEGVLLGKIVVGEAVGNLVFCGKGRLVFLSGERLYLARIASGGVPLHKYPYDKAGQ